MMKLVYELIFGPMLRFIDTVKYILIGLFIAVPMKIYRQEIDESYYKTYGPLDAKWEKPEDYIDFCKDKWFM